ncbi:MAG TPA: anti-sigma factor antagonist [Anaerolineales bacterium]|nr:anti-sigma factor antagonist [Anaerolineales bacterium]
MEGMAQFTIRVERPMLGVAVVHLKGKWHAGNLDKLRKTLEQLTTEHTPLLVVDMGEVTFIDSTVLSLFVSGLRAAREQDGTLVLARVGGQVRRALELTLLDRVFRVYPSVEEAIESLVKA